MCGLFFVCSPLCSHCAKLVRQRISECCTVSVNSNCSRVLQRGSVSCHEFYTVRSLSTYRTIALPLMQINCYSSLPLKLQSSCAISFHIRRQLSTARVAGSVLGRLLKLRYILLTGAVGGGITVQQVW